MSTLFSHWMHFLLFIFLFLLQICNYNIIINLKEVNTMTIGERIKQRRIDLGLSADDLANAIGKNRATIYRYENGNIENLPITILEPLAKALHTTPADLLGRTLEKEPLKLSALEERIIMKLRQLNSEAIEEIEDIIDVKLAKLQRKAEEEERNLG